MKGLLYLSSGEEAVKPVAVVTRGIGNSIYRCVSVRDFESSMNDIDLLATKIVPVKKGREQNALSILSGVH